MRLIKAQVKNYRSVRDSGLFDIELSKTILVGPNEAGKTAILRALQQINPPTDTPKFAPLRDYPRSSYNDITTGKVDPTQTDVAIAHFCLEDADKAEIPPEFHDCVYIVGRRLDNSAWHRLDGQPALVSYKEVKNDLARIGAHMESNVLQPAEGASPSIMPSGELSEITQSWIDTSLINTERAKALTGR